MALTELLKALEEKPMLGEYGAFSRPYVILDIDEYQEVVKALKAKKRGRPPKVPHEQVRV